jgi:hypothetical protein
MLEVSFTLHSLIPRLVALSDFLNQRFVPSFEHTLLSFKPGIRQILSSKMFWETPLLLLGLLAALANAVPSSLAKRLDMYDQDEEHTFFRADEYVS